VPTKIVLKVGFLERDFESDHLAEKATLQKWAKKYTVHLRVFLKFNYFKIVCQNWQVHFDDLEGVSSLCVNFFKMISSI
jgi:hypothetical protein